MVGRARHRGGSSAFGVLAGVVVLAGCAGAPQGPGGSMMGGASSSGGGSGPGYAYSATSCASRPASLPGSTVTVTLADMGMSTMMGGTAPVGARMLLRAAPASVPHGQVSVVADNRGWRTHELVILPLAAGAVAGRRTVGADGKVTEDGSIAEASTSCGAGPGDGITAGSSSWVSLTLPAGRYELVCNLANHYADGMYQELDVT